MERSFFDENFDVKISASPEKVDIKSKGDEAKEIEEFARCVLGDNFSFFDAFDDDDEPAEDVDDVEVEDTGEEDFVDLGDEDDVEEDAEEISGEDDNADLFDDEDEEDVDVKEGLIPSLGDLPKLPMPNLAEKKEKINELFNIDAGINVATDKKTNGIELEEGDLNINLDAHEFGGTGNDVDVLSKPDFNKEIEEAFKSWLCTKKAVAEDPLDLKELYEKRCQEKLKISNRNEAFNELNKLTEDYVKPVVKYSGIEDFSHDDLMVYFELENSGEYNSNGHNMDGTFFYATAKCELEFGDWEFEDDDYETIDGRSYKISDGGATPRECVLTVLQPITLTIYDDNNEISEKEFLQNFNLTPEFLVEVKKQILDDLQHGEAHDKLVEEALDNAYFWDDEAGAVYQDYRWGGN